MYKANGRVWRRSHQGRDTTGGDGLRMVFESWIQLKGKAGARQIKNARIGISQNYGGLPGGGISGMVIVGARD